MRRVRVRTCIRNRSGFHGYKLAVLGCARCVFHDEWMTLHVGQNGFPASPYEVNRTVGRMGQQRRVNLHMGLVLSAERTTDIRRNDAHHALGNTQSPCNLHPVPVRCLAGGIDRDPAVRVNQPNAPFCLEKCVFSPLGAIAVRDNYISRRERRLHITRPVGMGHHDVVFTGHNLIGAGLHRQERIEYSFESFIFDLDRSQRSISGPLVLCGDRGDRIPLKTHRIDSQQRLIRLRIEVTVFSGDVGVCDHGDYPGQQSCLADIQLLDSRPHMRAIQKFAAKHSRQTNIRAVPGPTGNDLLSPWSAGPLADDA